jgi:TRAF3-interacting protein 1
VKSAKVVAGLEPENTSQFLILLGTYAANPNCDSQSAVRRFLEGDQPGDGPAPMHGAADSKDQDRRGDSQPKSSSRKDDRDDDKGGIDIAKQIDAPTERGKSRGGTRGGPRTQPTSHTAISGVSERPANMDAEIDKCDGSFELTKDILGSLITKPKLSDKLLSKPPFRFLHDIIMEVIKTTNFGDGLYTAEEVDSANVKEKEQKILFLEKMLKLVGVQLNTMVEAKPQKIVAGLEPQDTNRFLQLLALAAKMMPDSREAVKTAYEQLGLGTPSFSSSAPPPATSHGGGSSSTSSSHKDDDDSKRSADPTPAPRSTSARQQQQQPVADAKDDFSSRGGGGMNSFPADDNRGPVGGMDDKPMEDASDAMDRLGDGDEAKKSMRPTTARRRPPKIKDATREVTAKDTAPSMKKTEGIMKDGQGDDDVSFSFLGCLLTHSVG